MSVIRTLVSEVIIFSTGLLAAVGGFGGSAVRFPLMVATLGVASAKSVMNLVTISNGGFILANSYKDVNWKEFFKIFGWLALGEIIGLWICSMIKADDVLLKGFGVFITLMGVYMLFSKRELNLPSLVLILILLISGVIHGMYLSGGVVTSIYAVQKLKKKEEFRATLNLVWFAAAFVQLPVYLSAGYYTKEIILIIILSIIPLYLATRLGGNIVRKIRQESFVKFVYILLIVLGILTIFK